MQKIFIAIFFFTIVLLTGQGNAQAQVNGLQVSPGKRFFADDAGAPFFWLGDTGWLLFAKLNREEAGRYLEDRRQKGFNVIQVMLLHTTNAVNIYGDAALLDGNVATPRVTKGNDANDTAQYDYWDHVDYIIDKAAEKGLYMALVPVWGNNVKTGHVNRQQAIAYAGFLAERYKNRKNIIWVNGGDISGGDSTQVWQSIGATLHAKDPAHLITFHPRGRTQSSDWFHNAAWLSFNMFQSGHRRYDQDDDVKGHRFGEDNWRYVQADYQRRPVKPTLDGEPSYENIPQGLHDTTQPRWTSNDVRRYGYWSVFAGACGYTYGDNAVMQMHRAEDKGSAYGSHQYWTEAINDTGASQMQYLKQLMLSRPYFERVPDQSIVVNQGGRYNYLAATRGNTYAFIYTYNGRNMQLNMGKIKGSKVKASWYNPRNGNTTSIGLFSNKGVQTFDPPGEQRDGNDWVLVLDSVD